MVLRDLDKTHHWQVSVHFYHCTCLFATHYAEQVEL